MPACFTANMTAPKGKERAWPLAHVPLIIDEAEWAKITHGLTQRAELLEKIVADIYADNKLVSQGLIPLN